VGSIHVEKSVIEKYEVSFLLNYLFYDDHFVKVPKIFSCDNPPSKF
jgi:hypothetical protein